MAETNFIGQIRTFFGNLAAWQRVMIVVAPLLIIAALVFLISTGGEREYGVLYSGLEQQDASKIVESLKTRQMKYKLADGGSPVLIEKD